MCGAEGQATCLDSHLPVFSADRARLLSGPCRLRQILQPHGTGWSRWARRHSTGAHRLCRPTYWLLPMAWDAEGAGKGQLPEALGVSGSAAPSLRAQLFTSSPREGPLPRSTPLSRMTRGSQKRLCARALPPQSWASPATQLQSASLSPIHLPGIHPIHQPSRPLYPSVTLHTDEFTQSCESES